MSFDFIYADFIVKQFYVHVSSFICISRYNKHTACVYICIQEGVRNSRFCNYIPGLILILLAIMNELRKWSNYKFVLVPYINYLYVMCKECKKIPLAFSKQIEKVEFDDKILNFEQEEIRNPQTGPPVLHINILFSRNRSPC